ncbi:DUF6912 family protein [Knoellia sp. p5-6-4]|uniref:DUF6912 family protein n=1 Tax=unclassified Knoellia TaxID=2618719 RepID=UPI0023DCEB11|nr:hypothetical protein [Knoellia sp. p5-6-4]MDF2146387.1 hypothetical protein [Knoellia sp. p5-6-4]
MSQTRVYVPLNASRLRELSRTRTLTGTPLAAFAVTARLERSLPTGDEEEWEYAALCDAVEAASELRETPGAKRVVAAADVEADSVMAGGEAGALSSVDVGEAVPLRHIVSFHIDELPNADGAEDLLWYDATELDEVARLM